MLPRGSLRAPSCVSCPSPCLQPSTALASLMLSPGRRWRPACLRADFTSQTATQGRPRQVGCVVGTDRCQRGRGDAQGCWNWRQGMDGGAARPHDVQCRSGRPTPHHNHPPELPSFHRPPHPSSSQASPGLPTAPWQRPPLPHVPPPQPPALQPQPWACAGRSTANSGGAPPPGVSQDQDLGVVSRQELESALDRMFGGWGWWWGCRARVCVCVRMHVPVCVCVSKCTYGSLDGGACRGAQDLPRCARRGPRGKLSMSWVGVHERALGSLLAIKVWMGGSMAGSDGCSWRCGWSRHGKCKGAALPPLPLLPHQHLHPPLLSTPDSLGVASEEQEMLKPAREVDCGLFPHQLVSRGLCSVAVQPQTCALKWWS